MPGERPGPRGPGVDPSVGWLVSHAGRGTERCRAAGIPEEVEFATKPKQAQAMIARAVAAGVPFAWFTADEIYGQAKWLQAWLEDRDIRLAARPIRRGRGFPGAV